MILNFERTIRHIRHKLPRRDKLLRLGSSFVLTSLLSSGLYNGVSYMTTAETAIEVTEDFADNFVGYLTRVPDGVFPFEKNDLEVVKINSEKLNVSYGDESKPYNFSKCRNFVTNNQHLCSLENTPNITDKSILGLERLKLDMLKNDDLSILKYCTNVTELIIENAQRLTQNDIDYIKKMKLEKLRLVFDCYEIIQDKKGGLNISELKGIPDIVIYDTDNLGELSGLTIYNYLKLDDTYNIRFGTSHWDRLFNTHDIKIKDDKLNNIILELNLKNDSDEKKFLKIVKYVLEKIDYDEYVSSYLSGEYEDDRYLTELSNKLRRWYNVYDISSVLTNSDERRDGICVNYASLAAALGYKAGLDVMFVDGVAKSYTTGNVRGGHAWNICNLDGDYKYFDLTYLDNRGSYYYNQISAALNSNDLSVDEFENIMNFVLEDLNGNYYSRTYESERNLDEYTEFSNKEVKKINEIIDGQLVNNNFRPNYWFGFALTFWFLGVFNVSRYGLKKVPEKRMKKRNVNRE